MGWGGPDVPASPALPLTIFHPIGYNATMTKRPGKFVHDAFREGISLRPKTWGKKSRDPRAARRAGRRELADLTDR